MISLQLPLGDLTSFDPPTAEAHQLELVHYVSPTGRRSQSRQSDRIINQTDVSEFDFLDDR